MLAKNLVEWRKLVLERDNYICQLCGEPAKLADHIVARKLEPELLLETDNGRALCYPCHAKYGTKVYIIESETIEEKIEKCLSEPRKYDYERYLELLFLLTSGDIRTLARIENKTVGEYIIGKIVIMEFSEYGKSVQIL